jgi:phospholipid/cholesterol/gamma-HCH transport system substrate-binding protein
MSRTARLGAFILGALIVFGVLVFLIGNKEFIFSQTYRLKAPFDTVVGLDEAAPVRAGGVRIGTVKSIELPQRPGDKIIVEMDLEKSTRNVIKQDSVASIQTEGLLGNKYMAISFGSADAAAVKSGDTIQSQPPVDYGDLAKKASDLMDSTKQVIDESNIAVGNVNDATNNLKSITGKIDSGQGTMGQLLNNASVYNNLNATMAQAQQGVADFRDDMDALKHNFFLRGFFKKRGYFDTSDLTKYAVAKLPAQNPAKRFDFSGQELFGKQNSVKLAKDAELNQAGSFLSSNNFGVAVVVVHTDSQGSKDNNVALSEVRANAVRKYIAQKFKIDEGKLRTMGLSQSPQSGQANDVSILVYPSANGGK